MKINKGDLVRLRRDPNQFYDWCQDFGRIGGFYLRDPETKDLLNSTFSTRTARFSDDDLCLVLNSEGKFKNLILVLNPRYQTGLIHRDKIEVLR
jgi:hypothetical protein